MASANAADYEVHLSAKIANENIRSLSAVLHLLQKVGKELILETENGILTFRSLNDSKSAFVSVKFDKTFFDHFMTAPADNFSCKVTIKPICAILRNLKSIQHVTIRAQSSVHAGHELVFEMAVSSGFTRRHKFYYGDCEIMSAIFDEEVASHLRCEPKVFTQLLDHFYQSPEISIEAASSFFQVKSFHQEQSPEALGVGVTNYNINAMKHMTTGLMVNIGEFEEYQFNGSGENESNEDGHEVLVVCSKELRAMLSYCEVTVTPFFFLYFTAGGKPIKLSSGDETGVKVELVLATLETKRGSGGRNTQSQQSQGEQRRSQPQEAVVNGTRNGNDSNHFVGQEPADRQQGQRQKHQQQIIKERDDDLVMADENGPFSDITPGCRDEMTNSSRNDMDANASKEKPIVRRRLKRLLDSSSDED